jgi:hypothetical protein
MNTDIELTWRGRWKEQVEEDGMNTEIELT